MKYPMFLLVYLGCPEKYVPEVNSVLIAVPVV